RRSSSSRSVVTLTLRGRFTSAPSSAPRRISPASSHAHPAVHGSGHAGLAAPPPCRSLPGSPPPAAFVARAELVALLGWTPAPLARVGRDAALPPMVCPPE